MIRINLLPQQAGGKAARSAAPQSGALLVTFILLIAFLLTGGVFAFCYNKQYQAEKAKKAAEEKLAEVKAKKETLEKNYVEVRNNLELLRKQKRILEILDPPTGRLYWAEKLNILPQFMPEGVYLTQLVVTEDVKEVETKASRTAYQAWTKAGKKGKAPVREMTPIIKQKLQVSGVAYVVDGTSDQRLDKIILFYNNLSEKKVPIPFNNKEVGFVEGMAPLIDFAPVDDAAKVGGRSVAKFKFTLVTQPLTNEGES